jgi:2-methylcitrate dehydratase PrpD
LHSDPVTPDAIGVENRTADLARHASTLGYESLPDPVVARASEVILDTLGAIISGTSLSAGSALLEYAASLPLGTGALVPGSSLRLAATDAALVISGLAHADETDDSHTATATHPGCVTVGSALAVAGHTAVTGRDFVAAIVAGYDVECRVSRAIDSLDARKRGFSTLGICGTFGAATTAVRALGFNTDQMVGALGLAGIQAAGLNAYHQDETHFAKALQVGFAARSGVAAALLAALRPAPPILRIFDGRNNVVAAFSNSARYSELTERLGDRYEIMGTSLKLHACGGPIRWAVDALLELMAEQEIASVEIAAIDVQLAHSSVELVGPRATVPAISLTYVMAVAALDRFVGIEQTHSDAKLNDPVVRSLERKVTLRGDDALQAVYPALQPAIVTIRLVDGRSFTRRVEHAVGSADRPMTRDQVEEKFRRLCTGIIGGGPTESVIAVIRNLDGEADVGESLRQVLA